MKPVLITASVLVSFASAALAQQAERLELKPDRRRQKLPCLQPRHG